MNKINVSKSSLSVYELCLPNRTLARRETTCIVTLLKETQHWTKSRGRGWSQESLTWMWRRHQQSYQILPDWRAGSSWLFSWFYLLEQQDRQASYRANWLPPWRNKGIWLLWKTCWLQWKCIVHTQWLMQKESFPVGERHSNWWVLSQSDEFRLLKDPKSV